MEEAIIMTVRGTIQAEKLGRTLPHEHIMCDFIGAEKTGKHRYNPDEVMKTMKPYLNELKERGWKGFVDCTPACIGRDVRVLRRLAEMLDLNILTNTGLYGAADDNFVPQYAYDEPADALARRWTDEWENGIEGTEVRPGFIKIGVDPGPLSDIDRKLVVTGARCSAATGLTVACHTGEEEAARETVKTALGEGIDPARLIIVHANGIDNPAFHREMAELGVWVEFDGVGPDTVDQHVRITAALLDAGYIGRILLSHDAGWYRVGEPAGGAPDRIRPFTDVHDRLIPELQNAGVSNKEIDTMTQANPTRAFSVS